jgi:hypothetical protein
MLFRDAQPEATPLRSALREATRADETEIVRALAHEAAFAPDALDRIAARARELVLEVRRNRKTQGGIDAFMHEFELSSREGVVLMCLAEALLRVPDDETVDRLIKDKLAEANWEAHLGKSDSVFVNASTWALMLTGRMVQLDESDTRDLAGVLRRWRRSTGRSRPRRRATAIPTTCWARRRAPWSTPSATSSPTRTLSRRSARRRRAAGRSMRRASRSSSRRSIRATSLRKASGSWLSWCRGCGRSPAPPRTKISALPWTPRRPTGSTFRSTS